MDTITLTINGNAISARAGRTILEVARQHGIYIPTLCHHDALRPIGACRLCQVEDEKRGVVVPACVTKISPGLVINTDSARVVRNRRNILRLLMAAHPESCVVCEKGNKCELRNLAAKMGLGRHGLDDMPYHPLVQDLNPFLNRDLSKCIMCAKCVRADQEVVCEGVIDYNFRGFDAHPATLFAQPLEAANCTFCGTCLSVCPVGAIAEKEKRRLDHAGAATRGVCSFCACGCAIYLEHDYNAVRGVAPSAKPHTANVVSLCVKGHFGHDYLNSPDRLRTPLIRTADGFKPIGWGEALELVAGRLRDLKETHGPEAIGFLGGARSTNEENYLFQKLARTVIGTNNIDFASRSSSWPALEAAAEATGFAAATSSFKDLEFSQVIIVIGADPTRTAPVLGYHLKRAVRQGGARLIVIDPVRTKLVPLADYWLRPKAAADVYILQGLIKVILEEDLADRQFVTAKTRGFEVLKEDLSGLSVNDCALRADVNVGDLYRAARLFASLPAGFIVLGQGLTGQADAADLGRLIMDLLLITGKLGKDRCGLFPVLKEANAQGALDMGVCPNLWPGYKPLGDSPSRERFSQIWGLDPPEAPGLAAGDMLAAIGDGRVKGLYVFCENTAAVLPGGPAVVEALKRLDFLVVQDLFLTETARLAHLVLPSAAWAEKDGTATNLERRVQRLHRAVQTPGGFPTDQEVFRALAGLLGAKWDYADTDDVLAEIERVVPLYAALRETDLDNKAVFWPQPGLEEVTDTLPHGIGHSDGLAVFLPPRGKDGAGLALDKAYPLVLMQGHVLAHLGSGVRSLQSRRLMKACGRAYLEVSPEDLKTLGLAEGDRVRVISPHGRLEAPVKPAAELPAGLVFLPASFPEARPNQLFAPRAANTKHCLVRLEKITG
ncbi:MAG: molybdopterin-dependent oxidoreductase [Thermodesulfobacteriota bacterium]